MRKSKFRYVATIEINAEANLKEDQELMQAQMRKKTFDDITMRIKRLVEDDLYKVNGSVTVRVTQTYGDVWEVNEE